MRSRVKESRERVEVEGSEVQGFRDQGDGSLQRQWRDQGNGLEEWSGIRPAQGLRFTGTTTGVYIPQEKELYSSRNRVQDYHKEYVGD